MSRSLRSPHLLPLLGPLALLTSCATTGWQFSFDPSPAETLIQPSGNASVSARALTTVLEGRREGERADGQARMHLRMLVENRGQAPVSLMTAGMKLVGSTIEVFGLPTLEPAAGEDIPPGETRTYEIYFPYPDGMDLSAPELDGLNLSWSLAYPDGAADVTQSFVRRAWERGYYSPEPEIHWGFFFMGGHCGG